MTISVQETENTVTVSGSSVAVVESGPIRTAGVQNALVVVEQETTTTIGSGPSGSAGYTTDLVESMTAAGIDTSTGRIGYDYSEGAVFFADNARYTNEVATINFQMPHGYVEASTVNFHLHWIQSQNAVPNWLGRYRKLPLGGEVGSWSSLAALDADDLVFSYGTTTHQITDFFDIDMTGMGISSVVQVQIWRDTANASTLFAGADAYTGNALAVSADLHFLMDSVGSVGTYDKDGL